MINNRKANIFLIVLALLFSRNLAAQSLVVNFGVHNAAPYAFVEDGKITGGIIKDIMDLLGKKIGIDIQYAETPRKRLSAYLQSGRVHIVVLSNPLWFANSHLFDWSDPLITEKNLFMLKSDSLLKIKRFEDLEGKILGTILGYSYPALKQMLDQNIIHRADTLTLNQNFIKLQAGRVDALIDSDILIQYYLKSNNLQNQFIAAEKLASEHLLRSVLSKHAPIDIVQVNKAYKAMKEKGELSRILNKYR